MCLERADPADCCETNTPLIVVNSRSVEDQYNSRWAPFPAVLHVLSGYHRLDDGTISIDGPSEREMKRCMGVDVAWKSDGMRQIKTGRVVGQVYLCHFSGRQVLLGPMVKCAVINVGTDHGVCPALVCLFHAQEYGMAIVRARQVDEGPPIEYQKRYSRSYTMRCHFEAHPKLRSSQLLDVHQTLYGKVL